MGWSRDKMTGRAFSEARTPRGVPGGVAWVALAVVAAAGGGPALAWSQEMGESFGVFSGPPLFRPPGAQVVLAVAGQEWPGVATEPAGLLGPFRFLPESSTVGVRGQTFRVLEVAGGWRGPGGVSLEEGEIFLAVPWTVGCGCAEESWGDTVWVSPGDTVVFLLTVTRREAGPPGPKVFDVLGWHQPYPAGAMIPYWQAGRRAEPLWLSPREFFDLVQRLPGEWEFRVDPRGSFEPVLKWIEEDPLRRERFPVEALLREWERALGGSGGSGRGSRP